MLHLLSHRFIITLLFEIIRPFDRIVQSRRTLPTQYLLNLLSYSNLSIPRFDQKLDNLFGAHGVFPTRCGISCDDILDLFLGRKGVFGVRVRFIRRGGVSDGN